MKNCLIYQPAGIGDLIWIQPIVDKIISMGYTVTIPVVDLYYDMVIKYIEKPNLIWKKESDDFVLKNLYGTDRHYSDEHNVYIPLSHAWKYVPNCSVMIGKYFYTNTPITNWHNNINLKRDKEREKKVFDVYNIDITRPFSIVNMSYGTPPNSIKRSIPIQYMTDQIINMSVEKDQSNNIFLFDWIGAFESAFEIRTVETSTCFLADLYSKTKNLFMYERKPDNSSPIFYNLTNKLYRNPNWTFEII
jgi:hypothetical protein